MDLHAVAQFLNTCRLLEILFALGMTWGVTIFLFVTP